tara:strand:+ start:342 stop:536 length:195 start_codon:yes stop_codon:yes gene_type:complete
MKLTKKVIYNASYALKMTYPTFTTGNICEFLKLDETDSEQYHSVSLGIWKANKKLNKTKGYKIK